MAGGEGEEISLEQTPSWIVAVVCTVFVVASLLLERGIHRLGKYFKKKDKKELFHTLEQIKNELMLLGFISLLLTVFQPKVASICMPERFAHRMLPCAYEAPGEGPAAEAPAAARRRLLATEATTTTHCSAGKVPVISVEGLHQLHLFIFVLAVIHVLYSCFTVLVGLAEVHSWKKWENQARQEGSLAADEAIKTKHHKNEPHKSEHKNENHKAGEKFTEGRIKYKFLHQSRTGLNLDAYVYSFFRQFGKPIYKADYLCLRMGFIAAHDLDAKYDFHSYIRRTMEEDFKRVVGISAYLWAFVCIFLLLDINGWYTYFWIAFIPTILVLIVGAKLQHIILDLAIEIRGGVEKLSLTTLDDMDDDFKKADEAVVVQPMKPRDDLFWFKRPSILIKLIHFILFQNAFELAFFFWALFTYGFNSCLMGKKWMIIVRLAMGVFVQILCSASTLPLYALVSQMGTTIRFTVFNSEHTVHAIKGWHENATKKKHAKSRPVRLSHRLQGIVGLKTTRDGHGHGHGHEHGHEHAKDIELPPHHKLGSEQGHPHPHPGHAHPHPHPDHVHPHPHPDHVHPHPGHAHPHPHPHPHQDDSHTVEIRPSPLIITNKNPTSASNPSSTPPNASDHANEAPPTKATAKPSAFANLTKLALEKEKEKGLDPGNNDTHNNGNEAS